MTATLPIIRAATAVDLDQVNAVIEAAIMTWNLPERVKRLSLPSYRYGAHDLEHLEVVVAQDAQDAILGVAAWEPLDARAAPKGKKGMLLHGIYVAPPAHGNGMGTRLLEAAEHGARVCGCDGLLVKAQPGAEGFFVARGFARLPMDNPERDYPHRFWKSLGQ